MLQRVLTEHKQGLVAASYSPGILGRFRPDGRHICCMQCKGFVGNQVSASPSLDFRKCLRKMVGCHPEMHAGKSTESIHGELAMHGGRRSVSESVRASISSCCSVTTPRGGRPRTGPLGSAAAYDMRGHPVTRSRYGGGGCRRRGRGASFQLPSLAGRRCSRPPSLPLRLSCSSNN